MQQKMNKIVIKNIPEKYRPEMKDDLSQTIGGTTQLSKGQTQGGLLSAVSNEYTALTKSRNAGSTIVISNNPG